MPNPSTEFAVALLGEFIALGVRDVVLCPGSRSQALALAAAAYEKSGQLRLTVRIDERVTGFVALGLATETGLRYQLALNALDGKYNVLRSALRTQ